MKLCDTNPFIRFACVIRYQSEKRLVNVFDCRMFFVMSGKLQIAAGEREYVISEGESFYCPGGSVYTESSPDGCLISMINFDLTQARREISECCPPVIVAPSQKMFENTELVEDCNFLNTLSFFGSNTAVNNKISTVVREFSEKNAFYREKSSSVMKELFVDIYRGEQRKNDSSFGALEKVTAYITANYGSKLCNKELAELAGY
ncbi:MAG: hypothetical protein IKV97_01415, partial [Clostridia bacterium]|nr:hypothetical protein [Clostridia bacterium]